MHMQANWGKPERAHTDHDNGLFNWNNDIYASMYLSMHIYPTFVAHWFLISMYALKCSLYSSIDVLTCMIVKTITTEQQVPELQVVCCEDY